MPTWPQESINFDNNDKTQNPEYSEVTPDFDFSNSDIDNDNIFSMAEEHLHLPLGSTKQGLLDNKQALSKGICDKTKELETKLKIIETKEKFNNISEYKKFDISTLEEDKMKIRQESHEVYDISRKCLDALVHQLDDTIQPSEKLWIAVSKMINSITSSLYKLLNMTSRLRQEEELKGIEISNNEKNTVEKEFDLTPQNMNDMIAGWIKEGIYITSTNDDNKQKEIIHE